MKANVNSQSNRPSLLLMAMALSVTTAPIQAAPGPLSQMPLFLAKGVQPNVFLLLDDSMSMDWEILRRGATDDGLGYEYLDFTPTYTSQRDYRLEHCVGYNVLAYDPSEIYTPWFGVDKDNLPFQNQSPTAAMVNPYTGGGDTSCGTDTVNTREDHGYGRTCNLTGGFGGKGAYYFVWHDNNHNKEYDTGECPTGENDRQYVKDLPADKQVNYANWFSYYRKREYVLKRAVSQIIAESRDRLGLANINNNNHITEGTEIGTPIKNVDDLTLPINPQAVINKKALMDNLLGIDSEMGDDGNENQKFTPLRRNLKLVGDYFRDNETGNLFNDAGTSPPDDTDSASGHSPILKADLGGTCQQNFVVMVTDGYYRLAQDPGIGNIDADDTDNPFDGQSYADDYKETLADVAMYNYKGDLLTNLDNEVPAVAIKRGSDKTLDCYDKDGKKSQECYDTNNAQHLVTFAIAFGLSGTIPETDTSGEDECIPKNRTQSLTTQNWPKSCGAPHNGWPEAVENSPTALDDLMHAAWNSRGLYMKAKDPKQLINQLQQAIASINAIKVSAPAAVGVDSFNFKRGGYIYQGRFDSTDWSGELTAREVTNDTISNTIWAAHTLLETMDMNDRILVTYNGRGIPFTFPSDYTNLEAGDLSQVQVNDLLYKPLHSTTATTVAEKQAYGERLVAYLRGNTNNEGTGIDNFRQRHGHRLGDIIHSSPVYVGNPDPDLYPDSIAAEKYSIWANNLTNDATDPGAKGRQAMLYLGANDGALHAFNAVTGAEVFAYYPQAIFSDEERLGLHWLADPNYQHRYYVDMTPAVSEVYADTGDADGLTWRTLLVGGLRGGGRAMYAIDVSDPTEFSDTQGVAGNILWEFTHPDLGYTYSKPTIAKLNNGHWAAIFGNGYNQKGASATGKAALFIKYLDAPTEPARVLYTTEGTIANGDCEDVGSNCNGLSSPAVVDLGADRVADRVYAGDLQGNLWVFDLSSSDPDNWRVDSDAGTSVNAAPLFVANYIDTKGNTQRQPITTQPIVTMHPTERHDATSPNTMVFFGTGQYITENDSLNSGTNSFYGIWDSGKPITLDRTAKDPVLVKQTLTNTTSGDSEVRTDTNNPVNYDFHKGWFVDLPDSKERVISNPLVYIDLVIFTTTVPFKNPCSHSAGYSWTMFLNLADGSEPDYVAVDVTGNGVFDGEDQIDDHNASGIKTDSMLGDPTAVDSGVGITIYQPVDDEDGLGDNKVPSPNYNGARSSWGILRYDG
jgi:type IV pilus assembly protein PilY1